MTLTDFFELYICIILTAEYIYDMRLNQHVKALKKRTKRRFEFEELNQGESK
jgi:hypothetical protein